MLLLAGRRSGCRSCPWHGTIRANTRIRHGLRSSHQARAVGRMQVSLIISVYRNVEALRAVLAGLAFQTWQDYEIIISEDGDSEVMRDFLQSYRGLKQRLVHATQPDRGWRKTQALNNGVRASSGDYLVFIDGDCVLHHRFMENHVRFASPKRILGGKRVKLGPAFSDAFRQRVAQLPELERRVTRAWRAMRADGARFYEEGFYVHPDGWLRFLPRLRRIHRLKGCNMSFYRAALETINGFDEDYTMPGIGEDIDLTWRFRAAGYELFSLRNLAVQYHLHHTRPRTDLAVNLALMRHKQAAGEAVCRNGIRQLGARVGSAAMGGRKVTD
jgi:GT2 family glycosyltransferase